jgi:hypothetical protein
VRPDHPAWTITLPTPNGICSRTERFIASTYSAWSRSRVRFAAVYEPLVESMTVVTAGMALAMALTTVFSGRRNRFLMVVLTIISGIIAWLMAMVPRWPQ